MTTASRMSRINRNSLLPLRAGVALAVLVGGCAPQGAATGYAPNPYPAYDYSSVAPAAPVAAPAPTTQQQMAAAQAAYMPQYQAMQAATVQMQQRLERVEKAMLRLDRRMQLVEKNELSRMEGQSASLGNTTTSFNQTAAADTTSADADSTEAMKALGMDASNDYRPVASHGEVITSALQAAPSLSSGSFNSRAAPADTGMRVASRGLPSLADPVEAGDRSLQPGKDDVAIWTVRYDTDKVWPDRDQLPSSRDVVDVLRENSKVNVYARGKNASSVAFRDRVKALSRYLAKVSSVDTVPIAAMAAPHLDDDTIEIVVTH